MKLYVEIDGEKHYIDEGVIEKYTLYEGYVTPFTGFKIKKEDDTKVVATEIKETETPLPATVNGFEDPIDIVVETTPEFATVSDESLTDANETNEALSKSEDMDVNESASLVREQPLLRKNFKPY
jgi:glyceraldehyde-3-phosphate dehydrogenase/erythrose-4-phosphate dehydrogenase